MTAVGQSWQRKRLRFLTQKGLSEDRRQQLANTSQVTFLPMEAIGEQGEIDLSVVRDIEDVRSGYTQFFDGDVVVAKITPCFENGKGALIKGTLHGVGFGTTELHVLTPTSEIEGRFLYYVTTSTPFRKLGQARMTGAAGQKRVPEDFVRDFLTPVPPLSKQRSIADFLDGETARLDALVAAKERLLDLLAEKRRALITRAVTRGLDPHAPLRDSGIPWLGEIPAHWRVMRAGLAGQILMGRQRAPQYENGTHMTPYLRVANVFDGFIDYADVLEMNFEPEEQALFGVLPGDILLNEGQSRELVGRSAIYRGGPHKYCFQNTLIRFRCDEHLDPEFAQAQFTSWLQSGVFQLFCRQSTNIAHLGADRLAQIHMVVPPMNEQKAIIEHVERETVKLGNTRAATERTITLLKERRTALISATVTGQLNVNGNEVGV
jgi:type I restriction enzyme, S subunit